MTDNNEERNGEEAIGKANSDLAALLSKWDDENLLVPECIFAGLSTFLTLTFTHAPSKIAAHSILSAAFESSNNKIRATEARYPECSKCSDA